MIPEDQKIYLHYDLYDLFSVENGTIFRALYQHCYCVAGDHAIQEPGAVCRDKKRDGRMDRSTPPLR